MKRFSEQLKKKSESLYLRAHEKRELRARLLSYMEYHPLPKEQAVSTAVATESIVSETFTRISGKYLAGLFGVCAMFVLVLVPVLAERAVPGDVLYPVKIQFNEGLRSTLALSTYEKIEWETERIERRIAEARLLASEGRLTSEMEAGVADAVRSHSDAAQKNIAALRVNDSDEAAIAEITFESALAVQSEVLESAIAKENPDDTEHASSTGRSVVGIAGAVAEAQHFALQNQGTTIPSYEKLAARIEYETTRAYELFASISEIASPSERVDIERRLDDIARQIEEAVEYRTTIENATSTSAVATSTPIVPTQEIILLRKVLSDIQKLLSFMTDIDVRENVAIEDLVPVTLTKEERYKRLEASLESVKVLFSQVEQQFVGVTDTALLEKIGPSLEEAENHIEQAEKLIAEREGYESAERAIEEATAVLIDIDTLTRTTFRAATRVEDETEGSTTTEEGVVEGEVEGVATTSATTTTEEISL